MDEDIRLEKQEKALVLTDGKGRQIVLNVYEDEVGIWFKFLKTEIRLPKLEFIRKLF